jgi:predicted membrane-bound spermidine synthase
MNQPPSSTIPPRDRAAAGLLFLLSGASGLLFETLWTYQATLALGSSYWAVTAVLSAFMAGLALGNLLALRRSVWSLATYALLEGLILVTGVAAVALLPAVGRLLAPLFAAAADHATLVDLLRFLVAFAMLAVPSTAMGMTLPALTQALGGEQGSFRSALGRLYGLNTLGAVAGVLAGECLLLPRAGVFGTAAAAGALNGAAALGAWALSRRRTDPSPAAEAAWDRRVPRALAPAFAAVFIAGFALLALEVVWTRFLALFIPNSSLAFALMLATVLAGIALGGIAGGAPWIGRRGAFLLLFGAGAALLASYAGFRWYAPEPGPDYRDAGKMLRVGFLLQFPVSFLSGAFFTLAGAEIRDRIPSSQAAAGLLTLFNTLGAAAGAVTAGFLLVPGLGVEKSFVALAVVYGAAAAIWARVGGADRRALAVGAAAWLAALALFPYGRFQETHVPAVARRWNVGQESTIEKVREGLNETIIFLQAREFDRPLYRRMITNSYSMSANMVGADRYMTQFVTWPVALHPGPRRALLICFGVGNTARALARTRELERIDVVDISRDILELSEIVFPDPAAHPLKDPRVRVHVEDGRFFLQTRSETWDLITGEPPPPEVPGVAGLYSREYFRLLRERLSEGGIATYWLPIHGLSETASRSILKAWSEVFETCFLARGSGDDLVLVGIRGAPRRVDEARFSAQWRDPATARDLSEVGLDLPEALGACFIGDGDYLRSLGADAKAAEDAFPKRVVAEGPEVARLYLDWSSSTSNTARFAASRAVSEIWPAELRERTLLFFKEEERMSYLLHSRFPDFREIHRVCRETRLKTSLAWALGSTRDHARAAEESAPEVRVRPLPQYHLGVRALAERDYARASEHLLRTVRVPDLRRIDLTLCLYALCMAGRKDEADRLLSESWGEAKKKNIPADHWAWMNATFGLKIPTD